MGLLSQRVPVTRLLNQRKREKATWMIDLEEK